MALVTASHHSFDWVHAEHAAPRSQRTGTRAGECEVFKSREAVRGQNTPHPGERPAPLMVVRLEGQLERHTGVGFELVRDPVVPQMAEQLVEVFDVPAQGGFWLRGGLQGPGLGQALTVQVDHISMRAVFPSPVPVVEFIAPAPAVIPSAERVVEYLAPAPWGSNRQRQSWKISHPLQQCFKHQCQWWSILHPRQR